MPRMELILKLVASKDQQPCFLCKNTFPPYQSTVLATSRKSRVAWIAVAWAWRSSTQHHVEVAKLVVSWFLFPFFGLFLDFLFFGWLVSFVGLFFLCRFDCLLFVLWLLVCLVLYFFVYLFPRSFVSGSRWNSVHFALFASRHNTWDVIDMCSCHVSCLDGLSKRSFLSCFPDVQTTSRNYWVYKDPYNGLCSPKIIGSYSPLYTAANKCFDHCSVTVVVVVAISFRYFRWSSHDNSGN